MPGCAVLDAHNSIGMVSGYRGMKLAMEKRVKPVSATSVCATVAILVQGVFTLIWQHEKGCLALP